MGQIPKLDPQVEEEIEKKNLEEDQKPVEESTVSKDSVEINTVRLDTIIKFEAKAKTETKENEENGTEGRSAGGENGGGRETAISGRTAKGKSSFVY